MDDQENKICNSEKTNNNEDELGGTLRIRNVEEINSDTNDGNYGSGRSDNKKRKLPDWLTAASAEPSSSRQQPQGETQQKRSKTIETDKIIENNSNEITTNGIIDENYDSESTVENLNANNIDKPVVISNNSNEIKLSNKNNLDSVSNSDEELKLPLPIKEEIKEETDSDDNIVQSMSSSNQNDDTKPVIKQEATSSSDRESCKFGITCYRRNPAHRQQQAHPGDSDYKRPNYPVPATGTPDCPYGDECYRRNPAHFQDYKHPPSTDFQKNWYNHKRTLRKRKNIKYSIDKSSDSDSDNLLKDFIVDSDESDFVPDTDTEEL